MQSGVLPLRPLTVGELLDAAVVAAARAGQALLAVALVLAAVEQALLYPLRADHAPRPPYLLVPYDDQLGAVLAGARGRVRHRDSRSSRCWAG